jgi:hypothetical protein
MGQNCHQIAQKGPLWRKEEGKFATFPISAANENSTLTGALGDVP